VDDNSIIMGNNYERFLPIFLVLENLEPSFFCVNLKGNAF